MIKRAHIHQFLAVVETGSFTQAAQRIRVTQPTLSSGIADLERLVGTRLFLRDRRHVRLTEAGARFLPMARELQRGFRAIDAFSVVPDIDWPQLRLGLIRTLASPVVDLILTRLGAEFSMEIVEGTDSELRAGLAQGRIDLIASLLRPREVGEGIIPLLSEPYVLFAATHSPLAGRKRVKPDDLASEIMIARRSCEVLEQTSRFFTRHGVRPRFALRSDNEDLCMRLVSSGIGVTTAPLSFDRPGLSAVSVQGYDLSRTIGFVLDPSWRKGPSSEVVLRCVHAIAHEVARLALHAEDPSISGRVGKRIRP